MLSYWHIKDDSQVRLRRPYRSSHSQEQVSLRPYKRLKVQYHLRQKPLEVLQIYLIIRVKARQSSLVRETSQRRTRDTLFDSYHTNSSILAFE